MIHLGNPTALRKKSHLADPDLISVVEETLITNCTANGLATLTTFAHPRDRLSDAGVSCSAIAFAFPLVKCCAYTWLIAGPRRTPLEGALPPIPIAETMVATRKEPNPNQRKAVVAWASWQRFAEPIVM